MPDYFHEALGDFVKNFAWGGVIEHLLSHGYSIDRMIAEERVVLPRAQIEEMIEKMNERRVREGLPPYPVK
ncbi:hypothetical protein D7X88_17130 [bacterium C-53]|nr:hypothetical protein [Lachnospiraceae bacterium]NBI04677.1 hypothetical protein [Lachnospiraceae bacterium]RKJ07900.1 hypothetical protein D7X88_17130 [bacterium C-53]